MTIAHPNLGALPACTNQDCGVDTFGTYHGVNCARSRQAAEWLEANYQ